jgi:hypothetical protein
MILKKNIKKFFTPIKKMNRKKKSPKKKNNIIVLLKTLEAFFIQIKRTLKLKNKKPKAL